jgi:hypothetical protein
MPKIIDKKYKNDEFIKKWLTGLSERSKKNYDAEIYRWIDFIEMAPTEQIKKRLRDTKSENITERQFFEDKLLTSC